MANGPAEQQRLPPGQHLTRDWPTLDLGLTPNITRERWRLDVYDTHGRIERICQFRKARLDCPHPKR